MVLKEAFRYKNYLNSLINQATNYLYTYDNYMHVVETHMRSKVIEGVDDEVKDNESDRDLNVSADSVISFIVKILDEEVALCNAIDEAKTFHCKGMDHKASLNKTRFNIVSVLKRMMKEKEHKAIREGTGYTFNSEGNQVSYHYYIEKVSKPDFDRKNAKRLINELSAESDKNSTTIDYLMSSVPVDFVPNYDINDTFEDLVTQSA